MATRKKRPAKTGDQHAAEELVLYIDNTSDLSLQGPSGQGNSVAKNALKKWRKGTYDSELAVKLFGYLVESGAKRYAKEMGSGPWSEMFDVATRRLAAEQLEEDFRRMAKGGELDHLEGMKESRGIVSEKNEPFVRGFNHAIDLWNAGTTWESISNRSEYDASPRGRGMYAAIQAMSGWVDDAEREAQAFGFSRDEARRLIEDGLRKSRGGREAGERGGAQEARGGSMRETRVAERGTELHLVPFESWADVMSYAKTGQPLYYQAPMDHRPTPLTAGGRNPFTYAVQKKSLRVWPAGSIGRGRSRTSDPFTADEGHLNRFLRPIENELPGRHGGLEHHRMAQQVFFRTRDQLNKQDAFTVSGMDAQITILRDAIRQMKPYAATNVPGAKEWLHSFEEWLDRAQARRDALRREHGAVRERGGRRVAAKIDLEEIGHIGDVNWPEYGGGPIYSRPDGSAFLCYVEPPTDDVEFNDPEARWTVYNVELEQGMPTWGDNKAVASTVGQPAREIREAFTSDDPLERASAYETWASYYGWHEFDNYPRQLTRADMNREFDADLGDDEDEDE